MGSSEYTNSRRGGWMHRETKYLGICVCVSSSWVFFCLKEPLRGLKYCKIWPSRGIPTSQGVKHPEQNRSYIISAPQSAPWGICKKHKHSYKCTENARHTEASAELLAQTVGEAASIQGTPWCAGCSKGPAKPRWQRAEPNANGRSRRTRGAAASPSFHQHHGVPLAKWQDWGPTVALRFPSPRGWIWASMQTNAPVLNPTLLKMVENFGFSTESNFFFFSGDDRCFQINTSVLF